MFKSIRLSFIPALASAFLLSLSSAQAAPVIGQPAPDFTATDSAGKTISLKDQRGKIVILEWKNHECPFVRKHYESGNMQALQNYAKEKGAIWLSITSSAPGKQGHVSAKQANDIAQGQNAQPTSIILDENGALGRLYNAKTTPHMFLIAADGRLSYMGAIDDKPTTYASDIKTARNYVKEALDSLLAGKPVETPSTASYGCGIKY